MYEPNFVFGYGSLVDIKNLEKYLGHHLNPSSDFLFCGLRDFYRCWNVAMNNCVDLSDYKYYTDKQTGDRPQGFITFLNICPSKGKTITGILFRVSDEELKNLDKRERNYKRIDVTSLIDVKIQGKVWAYIGLDEAEKRYQKGLKENNAMIDKSYFDLIYDAYFSLGKQAFSNYVETTNKPKVPILNLEIHKVIDSKD